MFPVSQHLPLHSALSADAQMPPLPLLEAHGTRDDSSYASCSTHRPGLAGLDGRGVSLLAPVSLAADATPEGLYEQSIQRFASYPKSVLLRLDQECDEHRVVVPASMPQSQALAQMIVDLDARCVVVEGPSVDPSFVATLVANNLPDALSLEGVEVLDDALVDALAHHQGSYLHLPKVRVLTDAHAETLGTWTGRGVHLDGVTTLSPQALEARIG